MGPLANSSICIANLAGKPTIRHCRSRKLRHKQNRRRSRVFGKSEANGRTLRSSLATDGNTGTSTCRGAIDHHGVPAPNAKWRSKIVPAPAERATEPPTDHARAQGETPLLSWARLLKRVFDIDIEHCPNCGGTLKIIACPEPRRRATIEDPPVIVKILAHLGLPTRALPRSPAQRFDLFQTI